MLSVEHSVELLAQIDGIVTEIAFDQDSWVKQGRFWPASTTAKLQAKLDHARDDLEIAQNNLKYQEAETKAKDAAYRRQLELRKYGLSSQAAEEEAEFLSKGAHYDVDSLTATVKEKEAEIQELQVELEKTRILAPFEGYVTAALHSRGPECGEERPVLPREPAFTAPGQVPGAGILREGSPSWRPPARGPRG